LLNGRYLVVDYRFDPLFPSVQGHCHGNNFGAKFADQTSFSTLAFQKRLKYCNIDEWIGSVDYPCTSCGNLVNFGPLTPEIMTVEITTFWPCEKFVYSHEHLTKCWTNLHQIFSFVRHTCGNDETDICFTATQGNQLILGVICRRQI